MIAIMKQAWGAALVASAMMTSSVAQAHPPNAHEAEADAAFRRAIAATEVGEDCAAADAFAASYRLAPAAVALEVIPSHFSFSGRLSRARARASRGGSRRR